MNSIKFRAWHKKRKTMVKVLILKLETKEVVIWLESSVEGINYGESVTCKFDDVILMQSTGIYDMNGVEVFEGDIVFALSEAERRYFHLLGTVEKVKGCWTIVGEEGVSYPLHSEGISINVRGNIHEAKVYEELVNLNNKDSYVK